MHSYALVYTEHINIANQIIKTGVFFSLHISYHHIYQTFFCLTFLAYASLSTEQLRHQLSFIPNQEFIFLHTRRLWFCIFTPLV